VPSAGPPPVSFGLAAVFVSGADQPASSDTSAELRNGTYQVARAPGGDVKTSWENGTCAGAAGKDNWSKAKAEARAFKVFGCTQLARPANAPAVLTVLEYGDLYEGDWRVAGAEIEVSSLNQRLSRSVTGKTPLFNSTRPGFDRIHIFVVDVGADVFGGRVLGSSDAQLAQELKLGRAVTVGEHARFKEMAEGSEWGDGCPDRACMVRFLRGKNVTEDEQETEVVRCTELAPAAKVLLHGEGGSTANDLRVCLSVPAEYHVSFSTGAAWTGTVVLYACLLATLLAGANGNFRYNLDHGLGSGSLFATMLFCAVAFFVWERATSDNLMDLVNTRMVAVAQQVLADVNQTLALPRLGLHLLAAHRAVGNLAQGMQTTADQRERADTAYTHIMELYPQFDHAYSAAAYPVRPDNDTGCAKQSKVCLCDATVGNAGKYNDKKRETGCCLNWTRSGPDKYCSGVLDTQLSFFSGVKRDGNQQLELTQRDKLSIDVPPSIDGIDVPQGRMIRRSYTVPPVKQRQNSSGLVIRNETIKDYAYSPVARSWFSEAMEATLDSSGMAWLEPYTFSSIDDSTGRKPLGVSIVAPRNQTGDDNVLYVDGIDTRLSNIDKALHAVDFSKFGSKQICKNHPQLATETACTAAGESWMTVVSGAVFIMEQEGLLIGTSGTGDPSYAYGKVGDDDEQRVGCTADTEGNAACNTDKYGNPLLSQLVRLAHADLIKRAGDLAHSTILTEDAPIRVGVGHAWGKR
jgi:hypothetical protein